MGFKLSLDDVEAWKGGGVILNPGVHPIRVVDEEIKEPGKDGYEGDHPVVVLTLEAIGGEEQGGEIRDWIHVTENTLGRIAQIYEAFKVEVPSGEFEWIPLKGKQAKVVVRKEPRRDGKADPETGKVYENSNVKSYTPLAGDGAIVDRLKEEFDATEVTGKTGGVEDDIPF